MVALAPDRPSRHLVAESGGADPTVLPGEQDVSRLASMPSEPQPFSGASKLVTEGGQGPILSCSGLTKRFGDRVAVDGVGFTIARGETYGLLGPNGAGKSTTISMVASLLRRDGGSVFIDGISIDERPLAARSRVGLVPQELAIYPDLTAAENLAFFGRLQGLNGGELRTRVAELLDIVGLRERANERTANYSGGMKRRLNIAAGLVNRPSLLILDEPTVGVDPQSRNAILDNVEALQSQGMAVLYTTHYMEEAERLCNRIGIIDEGHLMAEGTRAQLVDQVGEQDHVDLKLAGHALAIASALEGVAGVMKATDSADGVSLIVDRAEKRLPDIVAAAVAAGATLSAVEVKQANLESVFLHLTGRALRD